MIGREWMSPEGLRRITGEHRRATGEIMYVVPRAGQTASGSVVADLLTAADVEKQIARDAANLAYRQSRMEQERQAHPGVLAPSPITRFLETLTPMQAGRMEKTLDKTMRFSGELMSRGEWVQRMARQGACVWGERGQRRFGDPGGGFYTERDVSAGAMDFAEHMAGRCKVK